MRAIAGILIAVTCAAADKPEFFGKAETLPASGPKIGKRLPCYLPVELVNNPRHGSVSSSLD